MDDCSRCKSAGGSAGGEPPVHLDASGWAGQDPGCRSRCCQCTDDPVAGPRKYARSPLHLSAAPEIPTTPAPQLGEHSDWVLGELLKYGDDRVKELQEQGVIEIWEEG